jgi:transcriptional regulator with XRE-family HTH domain
LWEEKASAVLMGFGSMLALAAELDRSYVGGIERGEVNVALVNIVKLVAALELSVDALMKEAGL